MRIILFINKIQNTSKTIETLSFAFDKNTISIGNTK